MLRTVSAHAYEGLVVCFDVRIGTDGLLHVYVWRQWLDGSGSDRLEVMIRSACCVYSHSRNILLSSEVFLLYDNWMFLIWFFSSR